MARKIASGAEIWCEEGGGGSGPTLLLLHGLGCNADVWNGLKPILAKEWPGRWLAPDLRGHGRSSHRGPYGYAGHAADMAALLAQHDEVVALGHSMGGVVAMAMATGWFGVKVRKIAAFGVKIRWNPGEAEKLHQLAAAPARWFATEAEAVERYLKVSGLFGLVDPASAMATSGVRQEGGRFRLASDPGINAAAGPDVASFAAASRAALRMAAGSKDQMVGADDMRPFDPSPHIFEGAGHNVHVERPAELWRFAAAALS